MIDRRTLITSAAALTLSACKRSTDPFRIGSEVSPLSTGIKHVVAPWIDAVSRENPAFNIARYWGGTLGKDSFRQYDLVRTGVLDAGWILPDYTAGQFPQMGLFGLPFLFETADEASAIGWALHQKGLLSGFDVVKLIGFFTTEPNTLFLRTPLTNLDGLHNLKIRSLGPIQTRWLTLYDAAPQALSAVDMNQALSRGSLDGAIQGWTGMKTFNTFPLVSQAYAIPVGVTPFLLLLNKARWESLSPAVRASMVQHGGADLARTGAQAYGRAGSAIKASMKNATGFTQSTPNPAERARYRAQADGIHRWWIERTPNGAAVYAETERLLRSYRAA